MDNPKLSTSDSFRPVYERSACQTRVTRLHIAQQKDANRTGCGTGGPQGAVFFMPLNGSRPDALALYKMV